MGFKVFSVPGQKTVLLSYFHLSASKIVSLPWNMDALHFTLE